MLVLVVLMLVIRAHGCEQQMWGSLSRLPPPRPLLRRPPRSDRPRPRLRAAARVGPLPDGCPCFLKISEFGTRGEPKQAFGRADWRYERKGKARATRVRLIFSVI